MSDKLTPQQARFVEEYLIDNSSQSKAAIRAGYSIHSAVVNASRLMRQPKIRAAIAEGQAERSKRLGITQDRVLQELALIAFANLKDVVGKNAEGDTDIDMQGMDRNVAAALAEVSISTKGGKTKVRTAKVRLVDKISALEKLGKHLGMFTEKIEHSGTLSLEQLVSESMSEKDTPEDLELEIKDENGSSSS